MCTHTCVCYCTFACFCSSYIYIYLVTYMHTQLNLRIFVYICIYTYVYCVYLLVLCLCIYTAMFHQMYIISLSPCLSLSLPLWLWACFSMYTHCVVIMLLRMFMHSPVHHPSVAPVGFVGHPPPRNIQFRATPLCNECIFFCIRDLQDTRTDSVLTLPLRPGKSMEVQIVISRTWLGPQDTLPCGSVERDPQG